MSPSPFQVRGLRSELANDWDRFVDQAANGTFIHTQRFLGYHGDRFRDASALVYDAAGKLLALVPAARMDDRSVVSHPGTTHAGLLFDPASLRGEALYGALLAVLEHYRGSGAGRLACKLVPSVFRRSLSEDDSWALHRVGAARTDCKLSCVMDLSPRPRMKDGRKDDLRRARKENLEVRRGSHLLAPFWSLLEDVLRTRHASAPVHSLPEISLLQELFPQQIEVVTAHRNGSMLAGVVLFHFHACTHTQYLASSPDGQAVGALTFVLEDAIQAATASGKRWFSFGTSMADDGQSLNTGLFEWKLSFGASPLAQATWDISL